MVAHHIDHLLYSYVFGNGIGHELFDHELTLNQTFVNGIKLISQWKMGVFWKATQKVNNIVCLSTM
jgi:hypothetical protein